MNKMKAALIGFMPKDADPYQTLESHAKVGYRAFEGGDLLLKGDPAENRKRVESFGMQPLAVHYNAYGETDIAEIINNAHAAGVKRVACYAGAAAGYRFGGTVRPVGPARPRSSTRRPKRSRRRISSSPSTTTTSSSRTRSAACRSFT